jgi:hypothetical protein
MPYGPGSSKLGAKVQHQASKLANAQFRFWTVVLLVLLALFSGLALDRHEVEATIRAKLMASS